METLYTTNKISTLSKLANSLAIDSLSLNSTSFDASDVKRLCKSSIRYDMGKYSIGMENRSNMGTCPIWYTIKTDRYGKYVSLHCIDTNLLGLKDMKVYNHILSVFKNNVKSVSCTG
jgi:hypothetical protein